MKNTWAKAFEITCLIILTVTGIGKLLLLSEGSRLLSVSDPVFGVDNYFLLLFAGTMELICALWSVLRLLYRRSAAVPLALFSSAIIFYRMMLYAVGFKGYCSCLGAFTKALPVSESTLSMTLLGLVLAMYAYSASFLIYGLMRSRTAQSLHA